MLVKSSNIRTRSAMALDAIRAILTLCTVHCHTGGVVTSTFCKSSVGLCKENGGLLTTKWQDFELPREYQSMSQLLYARQLTFGNPCQLSAFNVIRTTEPVTSNNLCISCSHISSYEFKKAIKATGILPMSSYSKVPGLSSPMRRSWIEAELTAVPSTFTISSPILRALLFQAGPPSTSLSMVQFLRRIPSVVRCNICACITKSRDEIRSILSLYKGNMHKHACLAPRVPCGGQ